MKNKRLQRLLHKCTEIVMVLLFVMIFFGLTTWLLFKMFPLGITLSQVVERRNAMDNRSDSSAVKRSALFNLAEEQTEKLAATLTRSENEVKSKNANSLAWGLAKTGMSLFERDAVKTFNQASAQITFDPQNYLSIGSNSLIIIKRIEKVVTTDQRRSAMVMVEGELRGQIASSAQNPLHLEITTPSAVSRIIPGKDGTQNTDFRISVNPDHSSSIVVYKGQAEVSARGRTVTVSEGSGVTVKEGQVPKSAVRLPVTPVLTAPVDRSIVRFRELVPRVRFTWAGKAGETFRLQLARDMAFKDIVIDSKLNEPEFVHGNLKKGSYYWRVSRIEEGREGRSSELRHFDISQELTQPSLEVTFPAGPIREEQFILSGKTAPGVKVYVDGKLASTDEAGAFTQQVPLRFGMNLVTVEAVDAAGNVTYRSQYVQGRF